MTSSDRSLRGLAVLGLAGAVGYLVLALTLGKGFAIPVGIISAISAAAILTGPLGKALADRLHGGAVGGVPDEVFAELDDLRTRVAELEERADFSERMLAQARDASRAMPEPRPHE